MFPIPSFLAKSVRPPSAGQGEQVVAEVPEAAGELAHQARAELVELLYANLPLGLGATLVTALLVCTLVWPVAPHWEVLLWLGCVVGVTAARWLLLGRYRRASDTATQSERWRRRFVAGTLAAGLCWGASALLLFGYGGDLQRGFSGFLLGGLAAGAVATVGVVRAAYVSFALPVMLPLVVGFAAHGDTLSLSMAALTLIFMLTILGGARRVSELFHRDVMLRLANQRLVDSLTDTAEQLGHTNRELQYEIAVRAGAEEQLRLAAKVFEGSVEGIVIADAHGRLVSVNRAFCEITGYREEDVIGRSPRFLRSGAHDRVFYRHMWQSIVHDGAWRGEIWQRRKSGEIFPAWTAVSAVRTPDGRPSHFVAIFSDIGDRKRAEDRIEFLAHHDALTGLPNRVLLRDRFDIAVAHAARAHTQVALLFLDVDQFKAINDSLGHPAGDALLRQLADRLRRCVRSADTVCRQGGDEFVILLTDIESAHAASTVAEKVLAALREPVEIEGHCLSTSSSIGICLYPDDGDSFDVLLQRADTAMYRAKAGGRGMVRFFSSEMNANALEKLKLQQRLRLALERGEFLLHYQPQVALGSGRLVGIEALIRWVNPEVGLVPPATFIPMAEESGLIVPIGRWVLNEVCRQNRAWQLAGLPCVPVAVNLSALQVNRADLYATVETALAESGLPASLLELEITESILIHDAEGILETFTRLKTLGVRLSIDDFGTGYSSLAYLKRFPVDKLKIDRAFVRDVSAGADEAAIARAVIQMARSLKLRTVAEGVETAEQAEFLRREGCHEAQGFLIGKPVPSEEMGHILSAHPWPWLPRLLNVTGAEVVYS